MIAEIYLTSYSIFAFFYLWYRYFYLFNFDDKKYLEEYKTSVTIIIPYFNEKPKLLKETVIAASKCDGNNNIIVIDDGSENLDCYNAMLKLNQKIPFELIRYEKNKGKRHAQCIGFKKAKGEIIMTLDSDTILEKEAITNLVKPFINKEVGATTGQLVASNEKKNFLTNLISARYWNAFNFERKSQSSFEALNCCSGPISAYRKKFVDKIINEYNNQKFLGKKCTYGDDRHLTTLMLKNNYKIEYVKDALGYTNVPETLFKFIKQQIRWKKSWLRETYLCSKFMFKKSKWLSFEIFFTSFMTFFSLFARIGLIITLIINPFYIFYAIFILLLMASLHSLYSLFYKPKYFVYSVLYSFLHIFVVYWLVFISLITLKDTGWGTR